MRDKLKQLNLDRMLDIDELVELSAWARRQRDEYDLLELEPPEWLIQGHDNLRAEIDKRSQAANMAEIRNIENALEGLKTASERKNDLQRKLASLQRKVGAVPAKAGK